MVRNVRFHCWCHAQGLVNAGSPVASGYQRVMLSPGVEFPIHPVKIYADVEIPVYQHFTGNQLAAPVLFKVSVSYMF